MAKKSPDQKAKIAEVVCEAMRDGLSMRKACIEAGVSVSCFMAWVAEDEVLKEQYACAREALMDKIADDTIDISDAPVGMTDNGSTDSGAVAKQKLQVDTRKWLLSKLAPKKYGDKIQLGGAEDLPPIRQDHVLSPDEAYLRMLGK